MSFILFFFNGAYMASDQNIVQKQKKQNSVRK